MRSPLDQRINYLNKQNASFELADATASTTGNKTCRLKGADGSDDIYSSANRLCAPWGPAHFDKSAPATRLNLEVRLDGPAVFELVSELDAWAVKHVDLHAERLFKYR